ncbi:hypothetical protein ACHAWF_014526, partial [Thalassiosira exigua]
MKQLTDSAVYSMAGGFVFIAYLSAKSYAEKGASAGPAGSSDDYVPIVHVAAAAITFYYVLLFNQSRTAFAEFSAAKKAYREKKFEEKPSLAGLKYGAGNKNILAADRSAGNMNEQLLPFLVGVFMHATFVSVERATKIGWAWIFFRSYYGWAFRKGVPTLFLSTLPAYYCV